jgi:hypothetical protein
MAHLHFELRFILSGVSKNKTKNKSGDTVTTQSEVNVPISRPAKTRFEGMKPPIRAGGFEVSGATLNVARLTNPPRN